MKIFKDIPYSDIGHKNQILDVYIPECEEFPVFVYFHGGGLVVGSKDAEGMGKYLTEHNIALVSADYRMYPNASYPDFVKDAAAVVGWVHKNIGEYGNCTKIFVGGSSAGGYLSMMLCFDKKWLAPYGINPAELGGFIHDAVQPTAHFNVLKEMGFDSKRVIIDETAPVYHIGEAESYAPMMILVATNDMQNRYEQTLLLVSTMKHFGYDMEKVDFRLLEGRHCIYDNFKLQELVTEFIEKTI